MGLTDDNMGLHTVAMGFAEQKCVSFNIAVHVYVRIWQCLCSQWKWGPCLGASLASWRVGILIRRTVLNLELLRACQWIFCFCEDGVHLVVHSSGRTLLVP